MTIFFRADSLIKSAVLGLGAALLLGACGDKNSATSTKAATGGRSVYETPTDHALGDANAPITIVEYASVTCPHCATWSLTVFPDIQKKYIETGKVRYVFREFPTPPVDLANAGHLLANCAAEDKFFDLLHVQFQRQVQIRTSRDIKGEFIKLAKSAGMTEADFNACMVNQAEIDRLQAVIVAGYDAGVIGTPTFFINGTMYNIREMFTLEQFEELFAKILGEPIPETSKTPDTEKSGH